MLNGPVIMDKIRRAIFLIPDVKCLGLDEYSTKIFKVAWEVVGIDVYGVVQDFFQSSFMFNAVPLICKIASTCRGSATKLHAILRIDDPIANRVLENIEKLCSVALWIR
ncbi:hypothetical protein Ancab_011804 [Ancistrocladus abbreviatus]